MKTLRESINESNIDQFERELKSYKLQNKARIDFKTWDYDYDAQKETYYKIKDWSKMLEYGGTVLAGGLMEFDKFIGADWSIKGEWIEDQLDFTISSEGKSIYFKSTSSDDIDVNGTDATNVLEPLRGNDPLIADYGWTSKWAIEAWNKFAK